MKRFLPIALALTLAACGKFKDDGVLPSSDVNAAYYDASGSWAFTLQSSVFNQGNCGFADNPNPGNFGLAAVRQSGGNASLSSGGITYTGTVSRDVYSLSHEQFTNGWKESETLYFSLSVSTRAVGLHTWSMSYGSFSCDGQNYFSAAKQ